MNFNQEELRMIEIVFEGRAAWVVKHQFGGRIEADKIEALKRKVLKFIEQNDNRKPRIK